MPPFEIIAFDADDTLWQTERLYVRAQTRLKSRLAPYLADEQMDERLYQTEMRNLEHFGYGIKAFALSMIETAIELTDGRIAANDIQDIVDSAKEMLIADVELLEHAHEAITSLAERHRLMLVTKGDLRDQEGKIARSGLAQYFRDVEIVSDKSAGTYQAILERHSVPPGHFMMIGNSLRSDILPVLEVGGYAVYVPHELTWVHEAASPPEGKAGYYELEHLGQLPSLVAQLEAK